MGVRNKERRTERGVLSERCREGNSDSGRDDIMGNDLKIEGRKKLIRDIVP